jgi:osmotically-inducible protein OsmY
MKSVDFLKALGIAACLTIAGGAYAQNDAAATGGADTSGSAAPAHASKSQRMANRKLGYAVRRALAKGQDIDVSNITVRSRGGNITLDGSVPSQAQIDKAGQIAQGVSGVKSVSNKLTVQQQ